MLGHRVSVKCGPTNDRLVYGSIKMHFHESPFGSELVIDCVFGLKSTLLFDSVIFVSGAANSKQ